MSKSIVIKEVDTNKTLSNVAKLKTNKSGGGSVYWVPEDEVQLGTKSITQNGTYNASSDNKYGYSQVTVNVKGGNGSADSHGKPTGGDIKPGGAGSAVVGTDPETGEEVVVGVDESGNIVQTPIPYGIKIVTPPTKTDYVYQETMDYSGIGVKLTNKNGDTYTDVDHPSGWYVNPADLIFPVEKAPAGSAPSQQYPAHQTEGDVVVTSIGSAEIALNDAIANSPYEIVDNCGVLNAIQSLISQYQNYAGCAFCPSSSGDYWGWNALSVVFYVNIAVGSTIILNHHTRAVGIEAFGRNVGDKLYLSEYRSVDSTGAPALVGNNGIGGYSTINAVVETAGVATIPVKWNNPYTGYTHQDTFEITSTQASGDAHTSTGSSGTEGSGGGGSF